MTTIAYKDGIIATDGRIRNDDIVATDDREKRYEVDGGFIFFAGSDRTIDALQALGSFAAGAEVGSSCWNAFFVNDNGDLYLCGAEDGKVWMEKDRDLMPTAIGSGTHLALAAMDMGLTAAEAVEYASTRDTATGGTIREWRV